jgi:pimeloyl-ACP methyl ester carboxylesterase
MVHGWPESWMSWRHQIPAIAAAGYRAAALDVRGYGGSLRPHAVEAYDMETMVADLVAVAEALGGGEAILVGHDWGAPIVWNSALIHPQRFPAVAGLAIPYLGRGKAPFIDIAKTLFTDKGRFFYQVYIQDEGVAEAEMEADVRGGLRRLYYALSGDAPAGAWPADKRHGERLLDRLADPEPFPGWMNADDWDRLVAEFEQSGFRGPFNRYRCFHRDFAFLMRWKDERIRQPALFIAGEKDGAMLMFGRDVETRMREWVTDLRGFHRLPGCGHWTQQERPDETTRLLLDWLSAI